MYIYEKNYETSTADSLIIRRPIVLHVLRCSDVDTESTPNTEG